MDMRGKLCGFLVGILVSIPPCCHAQSDFNFISDFAAQIKSMDEFIQRFNGVESHPEISLGQDSRRANLWALFDHTLLTSHEGDENTEGLIKEFISKVEHDSVTLSLLSPQMFVVADVSVMIEGKPTELQLIFRQQMFHGEYIRWAINGVRGLLKSKLIDLDTYYGISPIEHEKNFMGLNDIFAHNSRDIMGYRGIGVVIDELSVFLTLAWMDKVRIEDVHKLTFHCLEVPGYVFTINEKVRRGNNSGWLITYLSPLTYSEKEKYTN